MFTLVIVDTICYTNLNLNQNHILLPFFTTLKLRPTNIKTKPLAIVVEVIVIIIGYFLENLGINLVLSLALTLVENFTTTAPLRINIFSMIENDLSMTNIIENLLQAHNTHLAHTTIQYPVVAHINHIFVRANALIVITNSTSDNINHHIFLLLNQVLIATEVDLTIIQ